MPITTLASNSYIHPNNYETVAKSAFWTAAMFVDPVTNFFTQGLSDFLALESLRHGTRYENYIGIRLHGINPKLGGGKLGAVEGAAFEEFREKSVGYFYLSKDSEAYVDLFKTTGSQFFNRIIASRLYCALSAMNSVGKGWAKLALRIAVVALNVIFVPTLKFCYRPEELSTFENDPDNNCTKDPTKGLAYRTKQPISSDRIGLQGILTHGFNGDVIKRMKAHPVKVTWGLIRLINPIGIFILAAIGLALARQSS